MLVHRSRLSASEMTLGKQKITDAQVKEVVMFSKFGFIDEVYLGWVIMKVTDSFGHNITSDVA